MVFLRYLFSRLISYGMVIVLGITIVFVIPRLGPQDPVETLMSRLTSQGAFMDPAAVEAMRRSLLETFGLTGTIWQQYAAFWRRALTGDFGPSFAVFPTPVSTLIFKSLPWTLGLLLIATVMAWFIGNILGLIVGSQQHRWYTKVLQVSALVLYPIPYYVLAILLVLLATYVLRIPAVGVGGYSVGLVPRWDWQFISSVLRTAFLPGLSIVAINFGWWFLSMQALVGGLRKEDFVAFAEIQGLRQSTIMTHYIARNALLPQVTQLAMGVGSVFGGALLTEIVFAYPGLGSLVYMAISNGDFNLLIGIASLSILAVATSGLIVDWLYPLIDPRVRYS